MTLNVDLIGYDWNHINPPPPKPVARFTKQELSLLVKRESIFCNPSQTWTRSFFR